MARWLVNPRRRKSRGGSRQYRPRVVRVGTSGFRLGARSPFKGKISRINPYLMETGMLALNPPRRHRRSHRRRHYRRNPHRSRGASLSGVTGFLTHPGATLSNGVLGAVGAFLPIALANTFLPLGVPTPEAPQDTLMSKALRFVARSLVGGLVIAGARSLVPRATPAVATGVAIGVGGSTLLDFLNTSVIIGRGDVVQTPGMLLAGVGNLGGIFGTPAATGAGAYVPRQMVGAGAYVARQRGFGAFHAGRRGYF